MLGAYSVHEKQGLVPDLQLDESHYELKGIRVDSSRTNYSGGVRSTGFSATGVAKKELGIANLVVVVEKAAKLDRDTFGVAVGQGQRQRRLEEIGGINPLAFGQFGEMGPGLEALLASIAKRETTGADEMADRYLIENRERGGSRVQMFHMRQRWGAAVWRAQTQVLLPWWAEVCSIPGWEEAESRRAADTAHGGGGQLEDTRQWV
jgi:hypothetical protein